MHTRTYSDVVYEALNPLVIIVLMNSGPVRSMPQKEKTERKVFQTIKPRRKSKPLALKDMRCFRPKITNT